MSGGQGRPLPPFDLRLESVPRASIRLKTFSVMYQVMARQPPGWARPLAADRALVHRAGRRLGHPASIPRANMSRSPEALAFGSRRHFIPASLSLPLCGCLLNRSRDGSRSRVPPRLPRRRDADAPAAASFSCLRLASTRFRQSLLASKTGRWIDMWLSPPSMVGSDPEQGDDLIHR
jgi:hypothetical protein